ncbi:glycosyltransferase family 61 protein [Gloeocapsa sp. BRSZ]
MIPILFVKPFKPFTDFLQGRRRGFIFRRIREPLRKWINSSLARIPGLRTKIIAREELFVNKEKYQILEFGSDEKIIVSEPYNDLSVEKLPWSPADTIGKFTLEKPFVIEVPNAELVGSQAVGFDRDKNLIKETVIGKNSKPLSVLISRLSTRTLLSQKIPSFGTPQVDTAYSLVNHFSNGYFHWITDTLCRIEGVEYYQQQTGIKPLFLLEANPPQWKVESLKLVGYDVHDCIPWNKSRLKVKRLIVPSFRRDGNLISPSACQWLRQRMMSNLPDVSSRNISSSSRIYIKRTQKMGRNIINEDELMEALAPFGFVSYTLEDMSFADKVRLFSQAEVVVAPHGAGLVNTIFSPQNLIVIDIFGIYGTPCFLVLAKSLGFHYGCLGSAGRNAISYRHETYNSFKVDVPKVRDLVVQMCEEFGVPLAFPHRV